MFIFIITFVVIMAWLVSSVVHTGASVNVTPQLQDTLTPVSPNFDNVTLGKISQLPNLNQSVLSTPTPITPSPAPTPSPSPTPTSSPTISPTPVASSSAQIGSPSATQH